MMVEEEEDCQRLPNRTVAVAKQGQNWVLFGNSG